tara:strand:+ start:663 stop:1349 length:687 start_codon:yes stop_codon:yes gene_type:complete
MSINIYSILIPVHNEKSYLPSLLDSLKDYSEKGHEVIIIDDGSNDGSAGILKNCKIIKIISLVQNKGKGYAIKEGLKIATNNRIIIYDGDMELRSSEISKLMILDKDKNINFVMGYRFKTLSPLKSDFDWGNFMFTSFFNILFKTNHKDILCCAKAFYTDEVKKYNIISDSFDIDVELASFLTILNKRRRLSQIFLNYNRRSIDQGKKLKISDGWKILLRIIKMIKYL